MKHPLPVLAAFFTLHLLAAQTPTFDWVKTVYDPTDPINTFAEFLDIQTNTAGNTCVFGRFGGVLRFDASTTLSAGNYAEAYFVAQYLSDGSLAWARAITPADENPSFRPTGGGITADAEGNVFLTGKLISSALRFSDSQTLERQCPSKCEDIFIARYNADGVFQWSKAITGGTSNDTLDADGIVLAPGGDLLVTGNYQGPNLFFDADHVFSGLSENGFFLARYTSDGQVRWVRSSHQSGQAVAVSQQLIAAPGGGAWVGGYYGNGSIDFGNNVPLDIYGDTTAAEYFVARYNAEGEAQEALNFHSPNPNSYLMDIAALPDSSLLISNDFETKLSSKNTLLQQTPSFGALLSHYRNGQFSKQVFIQHKGNSFPMAAVSTDANGQFYTGGFFGPPSLNVGGDVLANKGEQDVVVLTGSAEQPVKAFAYGGSGFEGIFSPTVGRSVSLGPDHTFYLSGPYENGLKLGAFTQAGTGLFIAKMSGLVSNEEPRLPDRSLWIQPNPTDGSLHLAFSQENPTGILLIRDLQGQIVARNAVSSATMDIRLNLPNGLYTCTFYGNKGVERARVLIAK